MPVHYPAGPWLRVHLQFQNVEKEWENVIWFKITGAVSPTTNISTVASAVNTALKPSFLAWITEDCTWNGVDVYLNNGTYTVAGHVVENAQGDSDAPTLPTEDAAIVTLGAGVGTRVGVGRIFAGGVSASSVTESRVNDAGLVLLAAIKTALMGMTAVGGLVTALAVWSRSMSALEPVVYITPEAILGHRTKRRPRR
jgi:hypothetical protein